MSQAAQSQLKDHFIDVVASANSGGTTQARLAVRALPTSERLARAGKIGGILFLLALGFVLVPFLHLFLVPGFLALSIIFSIRVFSQTHLIDGGSVTCPHCKAAFEIGRILPKFPRKEFCRSCHNDIKLSLP